ncbi:Protein kinase superfamily protein [Prunus dulcis]|uniref:non-specific serine/threonine protein kinase n=1 Tax=Prunus dulcis TaxID=3755 RepID=A0A4Y1RFF7_PRUDU|nr:Protein kinase superfamily protein [Prunus dulcis]
MDGERGIQRLLVYEYMPNRSLEDHPFNRDLPTMPWMTRLQVMLGCAQGLAYLHRDWKSRMEEGSEIEEDLT